MCFLLYAICTDNATTAIKRMYLSVLLLPDKYILLVHICNLQRTKLIFFVKNSHLYSRPFD
jgi:hypothetical protein